jgi:hypothetical protein
MHHQLLDSRSALEERLAVAATAGDSQAPRAAVG